MRAAGRWGGDRGRRGGSPAGTPSSAQPAQPARPGPAAGRARRRIHVRVRTRRRLGEDGAGGRPGGGVPSAEAWGPVHLGPTRARGVSGRGAGVHAWAELVARRPGPGWSLLGRDAPGWRRLSLRVPCSSCEERGLRGGEGKGGFPAWLAPV